MILDNVQLWFAKNKEDKIVTINEVDKENKNKIFIKHLPRMNKDKRGRSKGNNIDWKRSAGYKVKFIYNNIHGELEIIDYDKKQLKVKYLNNITSITTGSFTTCSIGNVLKVINKDYRYDVNDIVVVKNSKLKILERIKIEHKRKNKNNSFDKGYKYQCLTCGNIDNIVEYSLINKQGCNVCNNNKVLKGINDIWTTNIKLAKLLLNKNDGYKHTENSHSKVNWKCPNCENIINNKEIIVVKNNGLSCNKCGDGISYPEKIMFNILEQLNVRFLCQLSKSKLKWCDKYRYDFYIPSLNCIIETHGEQHYRYTGRGRLLQEEQENDKLKKELAKENNIEYYIVIDCRESELEWIKNSILNSKLNELFDLSKIDWDKCDKFACNSLTKEVCNLWRNGMCNVTKVSKKVNLSSTTTRKYLKKGNKLGWCYYDEEKEKINTFIVLKKIKEKKIICLNNNEIFDSIRKASYKYNIDSSSITKCCKNKRKTAGVDKKTGKKLQWAYYDDYIANDKHCTKEEE